MVLTKIISFQDFKSSYERSYKPTQKRLAFDGKNLPIFEKKYKGFEKLRIFLKALGESLAFCFVKGSQIKEDWSAVKNGVKRVAVKQPTQSVQSQRTSSQRRADNYREPDTMGYLSQGQQRQEVPASFPSVPFPTFVPQPQQVQVPLLVPFQFHTQVPPPKPKAPEQVPPPKPQVTEYVPPPKSQRQPAPITTPKPKTPEQVPPPRSERQPAPLSKPQFSAEQLRQYIKDYLNDESPALEAIGKLNEGELRLIGEFLMELISDLSPTIKYVKKENYEINMSPDRVTILLHIVQRNNLYGGFSLIKGQQIPLLPWVLTHITGGALKAHVPGYTVADARDGDLTRGLSLKKK